MFSCLLFSACAKEMTPLVNDQIGNVDYSIKIGGEIDQEYKTRAADGGFCDGDGVGVYVVNYESGTPGALASTGNQMDNVRYVYNESSGAWVADKTVYYHDKDTKVDFYGYYPYANKIDDVNSYPFEVKMDQNICAQHGMMSAYESSDFLWGNTAGVTPTESVVNIVFKHRMASISVTLTKGEGWESDEEWANASKAVLINNTARTASIDLATGVVSPVGDIPATGIVPKENTGDNWRAVIVPQTVNAGKSIMSVTINGKSRDLVKGESFTYYQGKMNNVALAVNKLSGEEGVELQVISESILEWENDGESHDASLKEYVIINCPEGGRLEEAITNAGYDASAIKNVKVIGEINKNDFNYIRQQMRIVQCINMYEVNIVADNYGDGELGIPIQAFYEMSFLTKFVFPKNLRSIGDEAFKGTNLTGSLILPTTLEVIKGYAFYGLDKLSGQLILPPSLKEIRNYAFSYCEFSGELVLPESCTYIGDRAFGGRFTGNLRLPEELEHLGSNAFPGSFSGDVIVPHKLTEIPSSAFGNGDYNNLIFLGDVVKINRDAFNGCHFKGPLNLPASILEIGENAFKDCGFTGELHLPEGIIKLGGGSNPIFSGCNFSGTLTIPESLTYIPSWSLYGIGYEYLVLPKTIEIIESYGVDSWNVKTITIKSDVPPMIVADSFYGAEENDNVVFYVPEHVLAKYKQDPVWGRYLRLKADREFNVDRDHITCLNAGTSKEILLRAKSGLSWSVAEKPDWIEVSPTSGVGKSAVSISVSTLASNAENREGDVVFSLDGYEDYSAKVHVGQYDYQYKDGDVIRNRTHTAGNGISLVFLGDCYDAKDISEGKYEDNINEAIRYFFDIEPYKTYQDYFDVYTVLGVSEDSGDASLTEQKSSAFGSQYFVSGGLQPDCDKCFEYANIALPGDDLTQTLIVLIPNTTGYGGITHMYVDGRAVAVCPMSDRAYPYDFRGVVQHEACGHGFGKLGDEYIYHQGFIQACNCKCCKHLKEYDQAKRYGWYENLSTEGNWNKVHWNHLIFDSQYSNYVDVYEGGYFHSRGVFRSEKNSCMNNNIAYFSAISRESIVKRIMEYSGGTYSFLSFKENDVYDFPLTKSGMTGNDIPYSPNPTHREPVIIDCNK